MLTQLSRDPTLEALRAVEEALAATDAAIRTLLPLAEQAAEMSSGLLSTLESPLEAYGRTWGSLALLNRSIAARTQDVEVSTTEGYASSLFKGVALSPIEFEESGIEVSVRPTGSPRLVWSGAESALPDGCFVNVPLQVTVSGRPPRPLLMRIPVGFVTEPGSSRLGVHQTAPVRFHDPQDGYRRIDPIADIPTAGRRRLRNQIMGAVEQDLLRFSTPLPSVSIGAVAISIRPHTYLIGRDLNLVVRTRPRRRTKLPLSPPIPSGYDRQIRLKEEHVLPRVRAAVEAQGGTVTALDSRAGHIHLSVRKTRTEEVLWIDVDVTVDIDYAVTIQEDVGGVLLLKANWKRYQYRIDAKKCWPICGKVMKKAQALTLSEIRKVLHLSFPFADLRPDVVRARGSVEAFGIRISTRMS